MLRGARGAVYVDGCFWHSCPQHLHLPTANRAWWEAKPASVVERDRRNDLEVAAAGWVPVRIWEHEDPVATVDALELVVSERRSLQTPPRRR